MVTVYGSEGCSQCMQAKTMFFRKGVQFEYVDMTDAIKEELAAKHGTLPRTLPFITFGDTLYTFKDVAEVVKLAKG